MILKYSLIAFSISVLLIPFIIFICKKYNWYDSVNSRKVHTGNIPRLGSIGFVSAFIISLLLCCHFNSNIVKLDNVIPLVVAGAIIFIFGVLDDFFDLNAKMKLAVQIIATLIMLANGNVIRNIGAFQLPAPLAYVLSFLWICGVINAFNLIDGVDGLCGGLSSLILITFAIIYMHTAQLAAVICVLLAAAVIGFLVYNKPKASIFMGDGGSQFLGFMIAVIPLYQSTSSFEYNKAFSIVLLTCIPVLDTATAMIRRKMQHRSFFSPDRAHLHHKLMNIGLNGVQILCLLLSVQILLCTIVCLTVLYPHVIASMIICATWLIVVGLFIMLHYLNRKALLKIRKSEFANDEPGKSSTIELNPVILGANKN